MSGLRDTRVNKADIVLPLMRGRYRTKKNTSNYPMEIVVILTKECNELYNRDIYLRDLCKCDV